MEYPHRVRIVAGAVVLVVIILATIAVLNPVSIERAPGDMASDMPHPVTRCEKIASRQLPTVGDRAETPLTCHFSPGHSLGGWRVTVAPDQKKSQLFVKLENPTASSSQTIALGVKSVKDGRDVYFWDGYVNFAHDINQDGYRDLRLANSLDGANIFFDYWLFNPKKMAYERSPDLKSIPNAYFNPQTKTVNGTLATGDKTLTEIRYRYIDGYFARSEAKRTRN